MDGTDLAPTSGTFSSGSLRSNYGRQRWTDDAARAKFFEYGGNQRWPIVGGKRRWHQPNRNFPIHRPGQSTKPKSSLNLKKVFPASLIPFRIVAEMHWIALRKHRVLQLPERGEVIVTEAELKKHLDTAEESPNQIAAAVLGLPEKTLRYKPSPDKWCIWEMLGHMAAMEILYAYGIRQMLADKHLVIAPIDQDDWAKNLGVLESSLSVLVVLYGLNRHANVRLLRRLKAEDLQKSIRHPELDHRVTVADYVKMLSMHGPNHLEQIERLKKEATGEQN